MPEVGGFAPLHPAQPFESAPASARRPRDTYAALDLGTNNCRLLVATPTWTGFRVIDAFSRLVRLGEGLGNSDRLSDAAIRRTIEALKVCAGKMRGRGVTRARLIATQACRVAANGRDFISRAEDETGLSIEIIDQRTEAMLAASGCAALADPGAESVVLFDIGGGSSEVVWLRRSDTNRRAISARVGAWASLPLGVVTLAERYGGGHVTRAGFDAMVAEVEAELAEVCAAARSAAGASGFHLLGTSGTVTTLAGIHLALPRYDRRRVDGLWASVDDIARIVEDLIEMGHEARVASPCVGPDRADLVLAGCAIFEAIRRAFPCDRLRVADRGLREGILTEMMSADGVWRRRSRERW